MAEDVAEYMAYDLSNDSKWLKDQAHKEMVQASEKQTAQEQAAQLKALLGGGKRGNNRKPSSKV